MSILKKTDTEKNIMTKMKGELTPGPSLWEERGVTRWVTGEFGQYIFTKIIKTEDNNTKDESV